MRDIDALRVYVCDSYTLKEKMHAAGINMKYLGEIAEITKIPYIMNTVIIDMVARAFKKVLNYTISDLYINSNKWLQNSSSVAEHNLS